MDKPELTNRPAQSTPMLATYHPLNSNASDFQEFIEECNQEEFDAGDFKTLVGMINSNDRMKQHFGMIGLGQILSSDETPHIVAIAEANLLPRFVQFLQRDDEPILQMQSALVIAYITSGSHKQGQLIVEHGAIPVLLGLLKSDNNDLVDHAIWALANISADQYPHRQLMIENGGVALLLTILSKPSSFETYKNALRALANITRNKIKEREEDVVRLMLLLFEALRTIADPEVLADATWALSHIISSDTEKLDILIEAGIFPKLMKQLENTLYIILIPTIKLLADILNGTDKQVSPFLVLKPMPLFLRLLSHDDVMIRRETCLLFSNYSCRNNDYLAVVLEYPIIPKLIELAVDDYLVIRRIAVTALSNFAVKATVQQKELLLKYGLFAMFIKLIAPQYEIISVHSLKGILSILKAGEELSKQMGGNIFYRYFKSQKGPNSLERCKNHPNMDIKELAQQVKDFCMKQEQ
jgi:hypothetical protein